MGFKAVRDKQQDWCRRHRVSGSWRYSPDPVASLRRKVGEELQEFFEDEDPAELLDLADALRALMFHADREGTARAEHREQAKGRRPPESVAGTSMVRPIRQRLWRMYGEYLDHGDVSLLPAMAEGVRVLIEILDPDEKHRAAHAEKVAELGSYVRGIEWSPEPDVAEAATTSSAKSARRGKITRWRPGESYGLISSAGETWFVSRSPGTSLDPDLAEGVYVTFTGSPFPLPGKPKPEAYAVRPDQSRVA